MKENILCFLEIITSTVLNIFDYLLNYREFPIPMPSSLFCLLLLSITKPFFSLITCFHKLPCHFWNLKNDESWTMNILQVLWKEIFLQASSLCSNIWNMSCVVKYPRISIPGGCHVKWVNSRQEVTQESSLDILKWIVINAQIHFGFYF